MIRKLLLILFAFWSFSSLAQQPELLKTWQLYNIHREGLDDLFVLDVDPPISPNITFDENFHFSGQGSCNTFSGDYSIDDILITFSNLVTTNNTCDSQSQTEFETTYFSFLNEESQTYISFLTEINLDIATPLEYEMQFYNDVMGVDEFTAAEITIFPNPVNNMLYVTTNHNIEKMAVFTVTGTKILDANIAEGFITVSALPTGIYYLEIKTEDGRQVLLFIKK